MVFISLKKQFEDQNSYVSENGFAYEMDVSEKNNDNTNLLDAQRKDKYYFNNDNNSGDGGIIGNTSTSLENNNSQQISSKRRTLSF